MIYNVNGKPLQAQTFSPVLPPDDILTVTNPTELYTTFAAVYNAYDTLLADVAHEKNLLGYGTDASGNKDTGLPIYEYVLFNPLEPNYPEEPTWAIKRATKVCLVSGVHGNERGAVVSLFNCIREIVSGTDPASIMLRNAAQYRIVPVMNPGGYNDNTRNNRHGVNLARNFSYNWGEGEDPGSAPYSEYETQALKTWCDAQAPTTTFMVDLHNHLSSQSFTYFYIYTELEIWKGAFSSVLRGMYDHYEAEGINLANYGKTQERNRIANIVSEFNKVHGVDAGGLETPNNPNNPTDNQWIKPSAELDGTFLLYLLKNYPAVS